MKKLISLLLAVCMIFSFTIFASASTPPTAEPMTTGLIACYSINTYKVSSMYMGIDGTTSGINSVVKSGFVDIIIQSRASSSATWGKYLTLEDYLVDSPTADYGRNIGLPSNYQYRVYWKHYAKKSALSTEKIKNYSKPVQM